jgi:hypothetical protein
MIDGDGAADYNLWSGAGGGHGEAGKLNLSNRSAKLKFTPEKKRVCSAY